VKDLLEKNKSKIEGLIKDVQGSVKDVASEAKKTAVDQFNDPNNFRKAAQLAASAQAELSKTE
jgi:RNA polymerase-binding transcription factor DksA